MSAKSWCLCCGPIPGLLFPVNWSEGQLHAEVQRCDECGAREFNSDATAARHVFDALIALGWEKLRLKNNQILGFTVERSVPTAVYALNREYESARILERILQAAEERGSESEPEMEAGDLQTVLRLAWEKLTAKQAREIQNAAAGLGILDE